MVMIRGTRFIYLFRHFNLTPVRNLDCTSSLQPAPVLLHLPVCTLRQGDEITFKFQNNK